MLNIKFIPNFQKYTKFAVVLLGLSIVIASSFALNSSLYQNKVNNSKSAKDYDFYLQYNKLNQLSPNYFTNKVAGGFEKIKIDVLPNHSDILLNNTKINAGDEINFTDLGKLAIFPKIDEYDNFKWSAISGSSLLSTVVSKFGVGSCSYDPLPKTIFSNDTLNVPESELLNIVNDPTSDINFLNSNFPKNFVLIYQLPQNGTLKHDGNSIILNQTIPLNQFSSFDYAPNPNFIGADSYLVYFANNADLSGRSTCFVPIDITINNRPLSTLPQSISGSVGSTITFPAFVATDSDAVGPATFAITNQPAGFVCSETNAGQVGNIISCVVGPSVVPGSYTFSVTPVDSLGLAGTPVVYTIIITQNVSSQGNFGGGTITITNPESYLLSSEVYSVSSSIASNSVASYLPIDQQPASSITVDYKFDVISTAKGVATVRTGGF